MRRIGVWIRAGLGIALVAASVGAGTIALGPRSGALDAPRAPSALPVEPALLVAAAPPPAPELVLPTPTPPPAAPYADVPLVTIASIEIPRIGVVLPVREGVWLTVIDQGPGHWPGTAEPGGWGNAVIAAHRTTHGGPFRRIGELVSGDEIVLRDPAGTFTYVVTGTEVVVPTDLWIVDQRAARSITLFACHPIGSAAQRFVVHGELARTDPA
jgi:sortase A